jgi:ankyrin repeat protein
MACTQSRSWIHLSVVVFHVLVLSLVPANALGADRLLVEAAKRQDIAAVREQLKLKADVNQRQGDKATALHWAAYWNDLEMARLLIRAGADANVQNDLGVTPLLLACTNQVPDVVAELLAAGAHPNGGSFGEAPLIAAAKVGNVGGVKILLTYGADVNASVGSSGQTALMWAAARGHDEVVQVLLENGANVDARSAVTSRMVLHGNRYSTDGDYDRRAVRRVPQGGNTPLLFAVRNGQLESVRRLLAAGAKEKDESADGTSALVLAAHSGHGKVAAVLVEHGADVNAARTGYTALHAAILRGDRELVAALLRRGANPNARLMSGTAVRRTSKDYSLNEAWIGATPFWLATKFAELEMMRLLAEAGANPSLTPDDGTSPIIAAIVAAQESGPSASDRRERSLDQVDEVGIALRRAENERATLEAVKTALALGASISAQSANGDTAMHHAALRGYTSVVEFLVAKGASATVTNQRGLSPLGAVQNSRLAKSPEGQKMIELLRQLGAEK